MDVGMRGLLLIYAIRYKNWGLASGLFSETPLFILHHSVAQMILFWKLVISGHGEKGLCVHE